MLDKLNISDRNRDRRYNENVLERLTKVYNKRHQLDSSNDYHRLFSTINQKILYEIELNEKKKTLSLEPGQNSDFTLGRYSLIYAKQSNEALRLLKARLAANERGFEQILKDVSSNRGSLAKRVRTTPKSCQNLVRGEVDSEAKTSVFAKSRSRAPPPPHEAIDSRIAEFRREIGLLFHKLEERDTNPKLALISDQKAEIKNMNYSKTAYLASLNYDFSNPL